MNTKFAAIGWTTTCSYEEASNLSQGLLDAGLISCSQVSSPIKSYYIWEGRREMETEYRITLKFLEENAQTIEAWLQHNHSYKTPQWIWVRAEGVSNDYLNWMLQQT